MVYKVKIDYVCYKIFLNNFSKKSNSHTNDNKGKIIYFDKPKEKFETDHNLGLKITLALSTGILVLYFIYPGILNELVSKIIII